MQSPRAGAGVVLPQNYPPRPGPCRRQVSARRGPLRGSPKEWSPFEDQQRVSAGVCGVRYEEQAAMVARFPSPLGQRRGC